MANENDNKLVTLADLKEAHDDCKATMGAASSGSAGTAGLVPAPPKDGYNTKYLRADGTWSVPPDTNTQAVTSVNSQTGAVSITPANIGAVANTGGTIKNPTADTNTVLYIRGTRSSGGIDLRCDDEGGNITVYGPNGNYFEIDVYNNTSLRCYTFLSGSYKAFSFDGITGVMSADGGFAGNATNVTGIVNIPNGGTGAINAAGARKNLGITLENLGLKSLRLEAGAPMDNGQVDLGLPPAKIPLLAWSTNSVCQPYIRGSTETWWVRLIDRMTGANISGTTTSLPINVEYIDA